MCLAKPPSPPNNQSPPPLPPNHFVSSCANYVSGPVNGVSNCPSLLHNQILTAKKKKKKITAKISVFSQDITTTRVCRRGRWEKKTGKER